MNVVLLGSDSHGAALHQAEEGKPLNQVWEGEPSNQRSDAKLSVHVPADRMHVYTKSIMRDT